MQRTASPDPRAELTERSYRITVLSLRAAGRSAVAGLSGDH
jgi:hypothetical protein